MPRFDDPGVADAARQQYGQSDAAPHRPQLSDGPRTLEEDADRDELDVHRAQAANMRGYLVVDGTLKCGTCREVLGLGHARRALVRLIASSELAFALRTDPDRHQGGCTSIGLKCGWRAIAGQERLRRRGVHVLRLNASRVRVLATRRGGLSSFGVTAHDRPR
jgi:hypothetical protein